MSVVNTRDMLEAFLMSVINQYQQEFGVLCFLYSVILTRGISVVEDDMGVEADTLVSLPHGHANQTLINLMIAGCAVPNVFDGNQDVDGMVLHGIPQQTDVGFLTFVETFSLLQVGSNLKCPRVPVWVVGSETHLTVAFSLDRRLVAADPVETAMAVFNRYDEAGGGFVQPDKLGSVLRDLGQDDSPNRITTLVSAMDPNQLGIILRTAFLEVLFPGQNGATPNEFEVWHYNGMARPGGVVKYIRGTAKTQSANDIGSADIDRCLRTRWCPLTVQWDAPVAPAIT
eukprot:m.111081 g.111081  ORF g.111081 m.111081 type:complete len:285 (+) comp19216_c0_seq4:337-1191(+)